MSSPKLDSIDRIGALWLPPEIIGTKQNVLDDVWFRGNERNPNHNCFLIRTDDPKQRQDTDFIVPFDNVVGVKGLRLTDERLHDDLFTKKLMCIECLTGGHSTVPISALYTYHIMRYFDWYVRWRLSLGIYDNKKVKYEHFKDFYTKLGSPFIINLIPWQQRFERYQKEIISIAPDSPFFWRQLSNLIGVTENSATTCPAVRSEIVDLFARSGRTANSIPQAPSSDQGQTRNVEEDDDEGATSDRRAAGSIQQYLRVWSVLKRLSENGLIPNGSLQFDPFKEHSARAIAESVGHRDGRTETLWPEDFLRILKLCGVWIGYSKYILGAVEMVRTHFNMRSHVRRVLTQRLDASRPDGAPKIFLGWDIKAGSEDVADRISLTDAVKYLMIAVTVVISGLGARRVGEVLSLLAGCVTKEGGLYFLSVYLEKTLRDIDKLPVPAVVKTAVEILEALSHRSVNEGGFVFDLRKYDESSNKIGGKFTLSLNEFLTFNRLEPPAGLEQWTLEIHEMRRGAAISYHFGFEWGDLDELAYLLDHLDPTMTGIYINEVVAGHILRLQDELESRRIRARESEDSEFQLSIEQIEATLKEHRERFAIDEDVRQMAYVSKMFRLHNRTDSLIGRGAPRVYNVLATLVAKAQAMVRVSGRSNSQDVYEGTLTDLLRGIAANQFLNPVPQVPHHCTFNPDTDDATEAECYKLSHKSITPWSDEIEPSAVSIDYAFANEYACLHCIYGCALEADQRKIDRNLSVRKEQIEKSSSPTMAADATALYEEMLSGVQAARDATAEYRS